MSDNNDSDVAEPDTDQILSRSLSWPLFDPLVPLNRTVTEHNTSDWFTGEYAVIPDRMRESIIRYVLYGVRPGSFLRAIITNNLSGAFGAADDTNLPLIYTYVRWFHNIPPARCWGRIESFKHWQDIGGLVGDDAAKNHTK